MSQDLKASGHRMAELSRDLAAAERDELVERAAELRSARPRGGVADTHTNRERSWHQWYVELDGPVLRDFLHEALRAAIDMLGEPAVPVREIHVRLSEPIRSAPEQLKKREPFQLTELVDADRGEFCIYLSRRPGQSAFYGQFAHEVAHLLNARVYDCYVEGLNTVFAERFLNESGRASAWEPWVTYFRSTTRPVEQFYAQTYFMMTQVAGVVSSDALRAFLGYVVPKPLEAASTEPLSVQHIDFTRWLASDVDAAVRSEVERIVQDIAPTIIPLRQKDPHGDPFGFQLPRPLVAAT